jgi:hypothetical protein
VPLGELIVLTGTVEPPKSNLLLVAERKIRGRFRVVARNPLRAREGQAKKRFRPEHLALYRFRFYFEGDLENRRARSKPVYVRTVKGSGGTAVRR